MTLEESRAGRSGVLRHVGTRRLTATVAAVVIVLALVAGGTAYALFGPGANTVTITPTSRTVSSTSTLSAVTGVPDASRQQVEGRLISATTPAETKTVKASGHLSLAATQAKGTLVLRNWDTVPKTFEAGMDFPDWSSDLVVNCGSSPADIILDATVTVPAAVGTATGYGVAYAPAHVLKPGSSGNIPGFSSDTCVYFLWAEGTCVPGFWRHCWTIEPAGAFTGGQDAYDGPAVQQSDIDGAASSLISANQPKPQQALQSKIRPNEQLIDTPQCTPQVRPNHQAGDHAAQVTISVSFHCAGEVYDQQAAFAMADHLLTAQAAANPGAGYALVGTIKTVLTRAMPGEQGTITLTIAARGVWAYQFTAAQQQQLATLLSGKSAQEAAQLALGQPGVASAAVHLAFNQQTLPTDPRQITIVVQAVPGA